MFRFISVIWCLCWFSWTFVDSVHTMFYFVLFFRFKLPLKVSIEFMLLVSLVFCFDFYKLKKWSKKRCFYFPKIRIGTVWFMNICVCLSVCLSCVWYWSIEFGFFYHFSYTNYSSVNVVSMFVLPVAIDMCRNCKEVPKNGQ